MSKEFRISGIWFRVIGIRVQGLEFEFGFREICYAGSCIQSPSTGESTKDNAMDTGVI